MNDNIVLNVRLSTDNDFVDVAAEGGVVPNAGFFVNRDTTDHIRACRDEGGRVNFWTEIFVCFDGHDGESGRVGEWESGKFKSEIRNQKSTIINRQCLVSVSELEE